MDRDDIQIHVVTLGGGFSFKAPGFELEPPGFEVDLAKLNETRNNRFQVGDGSLVTSEVEGLLEQEIANNRGEIGAVFRDHFREGIGDERGSPVILERAQGEHGSANAAKGGLLNGEAEADGRGLGDKADDLRDGMCVEPEEELLLLGFAELAEEGTGTRFDFDATDRKRDGRGPGRGLKVDKELRVGIVGAR